ncbi:PLDc N-terminal domain-containing protein [Saccharopolyspora sp. K220]|uniref:PLDc N-terminal domain-containing protein n=1 Tax=Saccharopolyspora soli TaxID=2926618 RepID=UPI001F5A854C|nr:PLDc N-terminal domain-containing protein [Saccharopolyspora soli]MCI2422981.1 PLDc N-terminal domain-containing protein [Saccharopolyspora soli]
MSAAGRVAERAWAISTIVLAGLVALAYVGFFSCTLVSILGNSQSSGMKVIWIIFAFCVPFLGPLSSGCSSERKQSARTPA